MTRIAVVSAMHEELAALLAQMPEGRTVRRARRDFRIGALDGHEVVMVLSGIGKVAAATTTALLAGEFGVELALFTGTAGGLHADARIGDVVVASELLQHDLDVSPLFPRYEVPFTGLTRFTSDPALSASLAASAEALFSSDTRAAQPTALHAALASFGIGEPRVHRGLVVSGDRFVSSARENADLRDRLPDALAVEMEGAALAQVCHDMALPFAVLRTVSDRADAAAPVDFMRFVSEVASRYTVAIVRDFLASIDAR